MRPLVVYIVGAGHSGSTILDAAIGMHPDVESVGELFMLHRSGWIPDVDRRCACGRMVHECDYWKEVKRTWLARVEEADPIAKYIYLQDRYQRHRHAVRMAVGRRRMRTEQFRTYSEMTAALYASISDVTGKRIIVDSSKNSLFAHDLLDMPGVEARVVHLIRDGRNVMLSYMKHRTKAVEKGLPRTVPPHSAWWSSVGWTARNLETEWLIRKGSPERVVRVRYEDFTDDAEKTLKEIGAVVGLDYSLVGREVGGGSVIDFGHMVAGNPVRMRQNTVLARNDGGTKRLTGSQRFLFGALGGWLNKRYGYDGRR